MTASREASISVGRVISDGFERNSIDTFTHPTAHSPIFTLDPFDSDAITIYLQEASDVELLQKEEEVDLAKRIERGTAAHYLILQGETDDDAKQTPQARLTLTHPRLADFLGGLETELRDLTEEELIQIAEDGFHARAEFAAANKRLVIKIAKKYCGQGVPFLDLIQDGNIGLLRAIEKFDYRKGNKFSTYATWWIRQAVVHGLSKEGRTIRVPEYKDVRIRKVYGVAERLEQELMRKPTSEEIANELGYTVKEVHFLLQRGKTPLSLEYTVGTDKQDEFMDFVVIEGWEDDAAAGALNNFLAADIASLLTDLTDNREREILELRFGLIDGHSYTLKEVGKRFHLTRERVRQIQDEALERIRNNVAAQKLREYHEG